MVTQESGAEPLSSIDGEANAKPPRQVRNGQQMLPVIRRVTWGVVAAWLVLAAVAGWWISQRIAATWMDRLAASAQYETQTTARVMDRLFIQMSSVANMVARQAQVIQLATRYRVDRPGADALTREERAEQFTRDPLVRKVGDFMNGLSSDLRYARIYMNNLSDDTVTASNWAEPDSIVGMIYTRRHYLTNALKHGNGHSFGIARLNKSPSYFVASRIDDADDVPQGSVTVKFDAPEIAQFLTGRHIALIVNRQGRVTTTSSDPFMLRNVAALLPEGYVRPSDDGEDAGEPMDIRAMAGQGQTDQWLIDGTPYLLKRQPLNGTQYQLLTLAALDPLVPMRSRHALTTLGVAVFGVILILLSGNAIGQMLMRRQDERHAAMRTSALNANLSAALTDAQTKERQKVEVLGYISHDLRAPLATISGYSKLLLADAPQEQHNLLQTIERSVKYQLDLIDELLEYTQSELQPLAVHPETTDLHGLLDDVSEYAVALCSLRANRFHRRTPERLPRYIDLDGKRLQQVLLNLLSNAAKFTHDGAVTLSITARPEGNACVLNIVVSDTGIGIDLNRGVDIFGAFQQIQAASGSNGLGLFIAQRILSAMGGSLSVASMAGHGTEFSFELSVPVLDASVTDWPVVTPREPMPPMQARELALPPGAIPPAPALDELAHLALDGRLTDIEAWIARHADDSAHALFIVMVRNLLEQFDFSAIHALAVDSLKESRMQASSCAARDRKSRPQARSGIFGREYKGHMTFSMPYYP
ncbi:sensor histidine kinase [Diaphorobacter ruginosibacter]|uniref:histidine kinase n=2 Tax=Diaphorobacter ruginosibacter TaxID=1715720 RepID=A0A7G9RTW2_9BURK|nr:sensor histidine kinase [Diaphorobacter ruginosibacter]